MSKRVYFINCPMLNRIKIGHTCRPEDRFQELLGMSPAPIEIIGYMNGDSRVERALHKKFKHLAVHGEWFEGAPELREYIEENIDWVGSVDYPDTDTVIQRGNRYYIYNGVGWRHISKGEALSMIDDGAPTMKTKLSITLTPKR